MRDVRGVRPSRRLCDLVYFSSRISGGGLWSVFTLHEGGRGERGGGERGGGCKMCHHQSPTPPETLYHRDDALLYIAYVKLIWAAPIPADRWHCSLWP